MEAQEDSKQTYQDLLDYWTEIVRCVLTAEQNISDRNKPILKDETMHPEQRVALYCQNVAREILRASNITDQ